MSKQVQLKILEGFRNIVLFDIKYDVMESVDLATKIGKILKNKLSELKPGTPFPFGRLKATESIDTVFEALWEYQKSLVEKVSINPVKLLTGKYTWQVIHEFYNPDTRIITITEFEEIKKDE